MKNYINSFVLKITGTIASLVLSYVLLTFFAIEKASSFFIIVSITAIIAGFFNLGATQKLISEIPITNDRNYISLFLIEWLKITILALLLSIIGLVLNYIYSFNFELIKLIFIGYLLAISKILYTILRGIGKGNYAEFVDLFIRNSLYIILLFFVLFFLNSNIYFVLIVSQIIIIIIYLITLFKKSNHTHCSEKNTINLNIFSYFDKYSTYNFLNITRSHLTMLIAGLILSENDIALYKVGIQISNLVIFGAMAVNVTQSPKVSRLLNSLNYVELQKLYTKGFYFSLSISIITIIVILLIFNYLNNLLFHVNNFNVPIIYFIIPQFIYVLSGPSIQFLILLGKVKRANYYQLFASISIIFFSWLFSPALGILTLILAEIFANFVSHVAATIHLLKLTKLKYPLYVKKIS